MGWEEKLLLGMRRGDVVAGCFLFGAAILIIVVSIVLLPELQGRSHTRASQLHEEATLLLREREALVRERAEISAALDQLSTAMGEWADVPVESGKEIAQSAPLPGNGSAPDPAALPAAINTLAAKLAERVLAISGHDERVRVFAAASPAAGAALAEASLLGEIWRPWGLGWMGKAANDQLVLVLTIMMGALGGVIGVARTFVAADLPNPAPSDYFIRPLFGMVIAFVIFLLLQAGQLVLTAGNAADPLSPFPIALLAVVSGLMASEAIATIERWGSGVFRPVEAPQIRTRKDELAALVASERDRLAELESALQIVVEASNAGASLEEARAAAEELESCIEARKAAEQTDQLIASLLSTATEDAVAAAADGVSKLKAQVDEIERRAETISSRIAEG